MNWIKTNTHQFVLGLLATVLLAASGLAFLQTQSFPELFAQAKAAQPHSKENKSTADIPKIESTIKQLSTPTLWNVPATGGPSIFVSKRMVKGAKGELVPLTDDATHPPVPNPWLDKNNLDILTATILDEDPDQDGFSNLDEYLGADLSPANGDADSTNPNDKESHPPYYTKLFLKEYKQVKFRLLFNAYDGDPRKDKPETMTFQINTVDLRQPSVFLKIGDMVPNTRFKLEKFEFKEKRNESIQEDVEVSELTLKNTESNDVVVLVYTKVTDSPDSYAIFTYLWPDAKQGQEIQVKKLQEFVLKPKVEERFKLLSIDKAETVIQLPNGEKYKVPLLPRK